MRELVRLNEYERVGVRRMIVHYVVLDLVRVLEAQLAVRAVMSVELIEHGLSQHHHRFRE